MGTTFNVNLKDNEGEMLSEWKKKIGGIYGHGGLKKKFLDFIKDDLEKIKNSKDCNI